MKQHTSCTTILVGKNASYDGSTMIARTEDSGPGTFTDKKFIVVTPDKQPRHYTAKNSAVEFDLPDNPMRYTSVPNADTDEDGIWGEAGINSENVAMSATETITTNERVLGADPMVKDGLGEEDFLTIVLPYIHSAREGVERTGKLLEEFGTYEHNGIAFSDVDEVWFLETVGGHHWVAQRVPDDAYATIPNQLGIQVINFDDPDNFMYSADLKEWVEENHLDLSLDGKLNARLAFGSHSDIDHHYNTPRAWFIQRFLTPSVQQYPMSDTIPFCTRPFRKITVEDIKYVLSSHYQDTAYDPYGTFGSSDLKHEFRPIGINRTNETSLLQIRPDVEESHRAIQWLAYGSMPFNTMMPIYTNVDTQPEAFSHTPKTPTTESFYWINRIMATIADPHFKQTAQTIAAYQEKTMGFAHQVIKETDELVKTSDKKVTEILAAANKKMADEVMEESHKLLGELVFIASNEMTNKFAMSD
ncbi:C69 family dipeptidase [Xylocopilactobacillus apicola]|uniref:Dipeptidase n=1 Tax=Xylocopilactobacillus apicola TaxID=2932184 RepID=A0AAU9D2V2_9LACO|nr:C69 family dipeptidase [Xylocopilactobacillus apicola]BDR57793.1 dipeptidase [Xylocopilactobacillus apicola]